MNAKKNKETLIKGNAAIAAGEYETFLGFCAETTRWEFVGEKTLTGKQAVRDYMQEFYIEPPKFTLIDIIAENDFVTAIGSIQIKSESGDWAEYSYCDVWRFENGQMVDLRAFVIKCR
ncbi:nuclear transport factor 2 family protein [Pedobacter lithocola]|uniref:Nuclear transport factor 2 family protein n=1 Tax=Pedobacter lithocola TaxID=1908239 RepID=A0ABV8P6U3_9SPHI